MVFSSLPLYLDPPNWQQQQGGGNHENPHLPGAAAAAAAPPGCGGGGGGVGTVSIRPNSMAERARLAKIPQPEAPLKCPRCDSTNTKFCYFNNYSLSQPRHFCKTCRRYWTRGGALRNVPVGGGCRRNSKRSKSSRSKSPMNGNNSSDHEHQQRQERPAELTSSGGHSFLQLHPTSQFSFMSSLQNFTQLGMGSLGLNLEGIQLPHQVGDQFSNQFLHAAGYGVPSAAGLYPFQNGTHVGHDQAVSSSSGLISSETAPVKMEDNQRLNINKQLVGMQENHHHFWGGGGGAGNAAIWTDLSGINTSSTTSHML